MEFTELLYNEYVISGLIVLFFVVFSRLFAILVEKTIIALTRKTKNTIDDEIVEETKSPLTWLILIFGIRLALEYLSAENQIIDIAQKIDVSIFLFILFIIAVKVIDIILRHWAKAFSRKTRSSLDNDILPLARKSIKVTLYIIAALVVLSTWGIDVTGAIAGLGIAGIAIGFAVKDSLANIFGGISLILDGAIKRNDVVLLNSGQQGTVLDVGLRSTKIKTFDNELLVVPNGQIANSIIQNFKLPNLQYRVNIKFGVEYGTKVEKVEKLILGVLDKIKPALKDPAPQVLFLEMADFSLNFSARFWIDDVSERLSAKVEATTAIYNALNKAKIGIPFPTRTLFVKK
ncbi:mechanosensitive ion channel family protein [Candidatus Woesearchaeota archaeon]|nr:mechanosensitive ion channel family protein [Candidatus Woesearchaeota archaeon]